MPSAGFSSGSSRSISASFSIVGWVMLIETSRSRMYNTQKMRLRWVRMSGSVIRC
jgi:hypothetical protein